MADQVVLKPVAVVPGSSVVPVHLLRFRTALLSAGSLVAIFGCVLFIIGCLQIVSQGGRTSLFTGPPLGAFAISTGIVCIIAATSKTPKKIRNMLIATVVMSTIVALICLVLFCYFCVHATWNLSETFNLPEETEVTISPLAADSVVPAPPPQANGSHQAALILVIISSVFYCLVSVSASLTLLLGSINVCLIRT